MFKKQIIIDKRAKKELAKLPLYTREKIKSRVEILSSEGVLTEPYGKKLNKNLFEIRVNIKGQWRVIYAYFLKDKIVLLSVFQKKTMKIPLSEILKASNRLKKYI